MPSTGAAEKLRLRRLDDDRRSFFAQLLSGESFKSIATGILEMLERHIPGCCPALICNGNDPLCSSRLGEADACLIERAASQSPAEMPSIASIDLADDPAWAPLRLQASRLRVRSAWTSRVRGTVGNGTITLCVLTFKRQPNEAERNLFHSALSQAQIALERRLLDQRLTEQTLHDPITNLPNRALLQDRLAQAIRLAQRNNEQLGLFHLDLDGFKFINETLGTADGDAVLREVGQRLQGSIRRSDTIARVDSDEFIFVASNLEDRRGAAAVAEKLMGLLAKPFVINGRELFLTASIGISLFPSDGIDGSALQRNADAALVRAKSNGRGGFTFFAAEMNAAALERLDMESQLQRALDNNEFCLHYQPQVDFRGRIVGLEALVRWQHPRLGLVPPGKFIPIAEQSGLILKLGAWVMREACRQLQSWVARPEFPTLRVAVNVSALQFAQPGFVEEVRGILAETQLDPRCLELELTESLLMHNARDEAEKVASVRQLGVTLAIDDFGTGYASLAYLHRLPIDTLKIDRSFVEAIDSEVDGAADGEEENSGRTAIIRAILSMARNLGISVLAEGVETRRQRDFLIRQGCALMQGYLFGRPVTPDQIEKLLQEQRAADVSVPLAMSA